ncbi:M20/M25/M40 family metallo-hydrolase [Sphingomonas ginkgonis]|uniref:M20/M25/M40 family metallo-hydrolase n=1 Tax=Sphingomonas ginkgonis TaxID=2315330 RepID=UPI00163AD24F|nr:M20/M25/M40 family metallo-hydrolase [Sphingomonas ginkgonis]
MKNWTLLGLLVAALLLALAGKSWLAEPPALRADNAPGQFDALAAKARLARILDDQRPHPVDTPANDAVRTRLLDEVHALGLAAIVRDQQACGDLSKSKGLVCARVRNVIVPLGPAGGRAILLNAHYDSVPVGPGAGDDGIGVATLLEVAAKLRNERLRRPVLLLFNEGEEAGLLGAKAFLADPLSRQVDSLVNLEARGVRGPVQMFETDVPNGRAIDLLRRAVARPSAGSLSTDLYRQIPNSTDVTSFAPRQWLTLNLAPTWNETRYHSAGDDLAALSPRTLQHMGDQTLALARALAAGPAPQAGGNRIFTDLPGLGLVTLDLSQGELLLGLLVLLFAIAAVRRRALGRALLAVLVPLPGGLLLGWLGLALLGVLREGQFWRAYPALTMTAVYAGSIAVSVPALATIARKTPITALRVAYWLLLLLLGALLLLIAPGGIVYFLLPPLLAALGLLLGRWSAGAERTAMIAAALLQAVTLGSMLAQLEELLNGGPLWIFAPLGALLVLPWLIEAKVGIARLPARPLAAAAAGLAVLAWLPPALAPAYSTDRQQQFSIEHASGDALQPPRWAIVNDRASLPPAIRAMGRWTFAELPYSKRKRWVLQAPALPGVVRPALVRLGESSGPGGRRLRLRLVAPGADAIMLRLPPGAALTAAGLASPQRLIAADRDGYMIRCVGRSCDGSVLDLVFRNSRPVTADLTAVRYALPPAAAPLLRARPPVARPQYVPDETLTLARTRL